MYANYVMFVLFLFFYI